MRIGYAFAGLLFGCVCTIPAQTQTPAEKAWSILKQGIADKSAEKRAKAYRALALVIGNSASQQMAEKGLSDEKPEVRSAAAAALGQMGAKSSIPKLQQLARDKEADVVFSATDALFRLGDPSAFHVYYAVLTGEKKSGEGLMESQMKLLKDPKALAQLGFEQGIGFIPFAGAGYGVFKAIGKDDASPIRAAAATKLARDPDPKTAQALSRAASDSKWVVRVAVVDAIARRGDPSLLPALTPLLNDGNDDVKFNAAAAFLRLSYIKK